MVNEFTALQWQTIPPGDTTTLGQQVMAANGFSIPGWYVLHGAHPLHLSKRSHSNFVPLRSFSSRVHHVTELLLLEQSTGAFPWAFSSTQLLIMVLYDGHHTKFVHLHVLTLLKQAVVHIGGGVQPLAFWWDIYSFSTLS